jgi:hypothetical protein
MPFPEQVTFNCQSLELVLAASARWSLICPAVETTVSRSFSASDNLPSTRWRAAVAFRN